STSTSTSHQPTTTTSTSSTTTTSLHECGDGVVQPGEQCDLGPANGAPGSCCAATCAFRAAGEECRPAAGACDAAETCTGRGPGCPPDQLRPRGDVCRPAATACDRREVCDGTSRDCPPDTKRSPGDECDDGNPETGTSSCTDALECRGVTTMVEVQPVIPVAANQSPKQVKIPVTVEISDTPGTKKAKVVLQGLVACLHLPPQLRLPR